MTTSYGKDYPHKGHILHLTRRGGGAGPIASLNPYLLRELAERAAGGESLTSIGRDLKLSGSQVAMRLRLLSSSLLDKHPTLGRTLDYVSIGKTFLQAVPLKKERDIIDNLLQGGLPAYISPVISIPERMIESYTYYARNHFSCGVNCKLKKRGYADLMRNYLKELSEGTPVSDQP